MKMERPWMDTGSICNLYNIPKDIHCSYLVFVRKQLEIERTPEETHQHIQESIDELTDKFFDVFKYFSTLVF